MVEYLGDIEGRTFHKTYEEALHKISTDFPDEDTPDPEDDRILVWEILETGHAKVVWHFSGWHWDANEFNLPQGKLPGHEKSLYEIACFDL